MSIKVKLAVVPDSPLNSALQRVYGRYTSDLRRINVNQVDSDLTGWLYTILVTPEDFTEILEAGGLQQWLGLIVATLKQNIKDPIVVELSYPSEWLTLELSDESPLYEAWQILDRTIQAVVASGRIPDFSYNPLPPITQPIQQRVHQASPVRNTGNEITVRDLLSGNVRGFNPNDDDNEDDDDSDEDEDDEDIMRLLAKQSDVKRPKLGPSKVLTNAKNPKRDLNRHGVIIADSRDDLDKDRKMIKAFLKEFIPGNQYWRKELRRTLAQRWIRVYAVSKKTHRELEKEFRRSRHVETASGLLSVTRNLFTTPLSDNWDDPSR